VGQPGKAPFPYLHYLRRAVQVGIVVAAAVTGYRFAAGLSLTHIEKYCPMGGVATSYSVATEQRFSCATGEFNFSLAIALLVLAILARKSFCSWLCPVGTVSELVGNLVGRLKGKRNRVRSGTDSALYAPPRKADGGLRLLRVPVLAAILYFTVLTGELIFRPFCPYYVMFSFHGHDVEMWSYALLALFVAGIIVIPMIWCRYLCPLGGLLWPFSRTGVLRIRRDAGSCTDCGICNRACPQSIPVATSDPVRSGECTLCLECTQACPVPGTLKVSAAGTRRALPGLLVPIAVALLVVAGLIGGQLYAVPSFARDYEAAQADAGRLEEVRFKVKGVRCVDTAILAATVYDGYPGIRRFTAYASRNQVVVEFDAAIVDVPKLVRLLEGPVYIESAQEFVFHIYEVLEIDGKPVPTEEKKPKGGTP
jgi:NAD-dependent dihydropyrimidine dehydrogenase PreA subunit